MCREGVVTFFFLNETIYNIPKYYLCYQFYFEVITYDTKKMKVSPMFILISSKDFSVIGHTIPSYYIIDNFSKILRMQFIARTKIRGRT